MDLREQLLAAGKDSPMLEEYPIKEWGITVWIKIMSGSERDGFDAMLAKYQNPKTKKFKATPDTIKALRHRLILSCVCNEKGETVLQQEDMATIDEKRGAVTAALVQKILVCNGLDDDDQDALVGNLSDDPTE